MKSVDSESRQLIVKGMNTGLNCKQSPLSVKTLILSKVLGKKKI